MDLLAGYGSDTSDASEASSTKPAAAASSESYKESLPAKCAQVVPSLSSSTNRHQVTRRGRKLVSLHAVLPQHILDQLIKSEAQGWDDSDEDEDGDSNKKPLTARNSKTIPKSSNKDNQVVPQHRDAGISSFLSDLKSAATTTAIANTERNPSPLPTSPIFETDVKAPLQARKYEARSNETKVLVSSSQQLDDVDEAPVIKKITMSRPSHIVAAPRIEPDNIKRTPEPSLAVPTSSQLASQIPQPSTVPRTAPADLSLGSQQPGYNKRSRRAMEQALRSGNFAALGSDDQVPMVSVDAPAPDAYEPPDEQQQSSRLPSHGVKVVPVKMYDPKAGIDVASAHVGGGKQRSKHQITQLMVSAAALEQQRARGMGGSDVGSTHRANAKRKYGW